MKGVEMIKKLNYTPHTINLPNITIDPIGIVSRCKEITQAADTINGVDVITRSYGKVINAPKEHPHKVYIVSLLVRLALPHRKDLLSPGDIIRDKEGNIIGCVNLVMN